MTLMLGCGRSRLASPEGFAQRCRYRAPGKCIVVPRLSSDEYKATMEAAPERVDDEMAPPFDFWPYLDALPPDEFDGLDFSAGQVTYAWNMPSGRWQHVLINEASDRNTFFVLVLDLMSREVYGHHVLRLADEYGLDE